MKDVIFALTANISSNHLVRLEQIQWRLDERLRNNYFLFTCRIVSVRKKWTWEREKEIKNDKKVNWINGIKEDKAESDKEGQEMKGN